MSLELIRAGFIVQLLLSVGDLDIDYDHQVEIMKMEQASHLESRMRQSSGPTDPVQLVFPRNQLEPTGVV